MTTTRIVAYYRVSTARQGESGLGIEAQQTAVADYARRTGAEIVSSYTEFETGKRADRPELADAISHARRSNAALVVGKLDRLARSMTFTAQLMDSGIEFVACDNPHANRLTLHILAAVAEHEARQISQRTRDALAAAKKRGVKLGSARPGHWKGREDKRRTGQARAAVAAGISHRRRADEAYADLVPELKAMRADGLSLRKIAARLNEQGHTTRRGKPWNQVQVRSVLLRFSDS